MMRLVALHLRGMYLFRGQLYASGILGLGGSFTGQRSRPVRGPS